MKFWLHKIIARFILTRLGGLSREEAATRVALNVALLDDIAAGVPMEQALRTLAERRAARRCRARTRAVPPSCASPVKPRRVTTLAAQPIDQ